MISAVIYQSKCVCLIETNMMNELTDHSITCFLSKHATESASCLKTLIVQQ